MRYPRAFNRGAASQSTARRTLVRLLNRPLRHLPSAALRLTYDLDGFPLVLPLSHPLPRIVAVDAHYQVPLRLLAESFDVNGSTAIDIGANVGDTATILALGGCTDVVCVEGNEAFIPSLRANASTAAQRGWNFRIVERYVAVGGADLSTARVETRYGTAKVVVDDHAALGTQAFIGVQDVLESCEHVAVLKIDTDGMDLAILQAFLDADDQRAIKSFFVEFTPASESLVPQLAYLDRHGFEKLHWFDHHGNYVLSSNTTDQETASRMTAIAETQNAYFDVAALRADAATCSRFDSKCRSLQPLGGHA